MDVETVAKIVKVCDDSTQLAHLARRLTQGSYTGGLLPDYNIKLVETKDSINKALGMNTISLDVYNWTGTQNVTTDSYLEIPELDLIKSLDGGVSTVTDNVIKLPSVESQTGVFITVRITGTTPSANPDAEWFIQLRRPTDAIITSVAASKIANNNQLDNRESFVSSYTNGVLDPFHTDGFKVSLQNKTAATLTITSISMRVLRIIN